MYEAAKHQAPSKVVLSNQAGEPDEPDSLAMRYLIVQQSEEQAATDVTKSRQSLDVVSDTSSEESLK